MIQQFKAFLAAIGETNLFLLSGGFFGALIYARHRKLKLWEAITAVVLGTASSALLGPFIVHAIGYESNHSAYAAIGFITGMLVKEIAELIFKVIDEIQANPKLVTDFLRRIRRK